MSGLSSYRMDSWATPGRRIAKYVLKTNTLKNNHSKTNSFERTQTVTFFEQIHLAVCLFGCCVYLLFSELLRVAPKCFAKVIVLCFTNIQYWGSASILQFRDKTEEDDIVLPLWLYHHGLTEQSWQKQTWQKKYLTETELTESILECIRNDKYQLDMKYQLDPGS